jgi:putative component of membrane protein insertase Oxa1/YidC/SpoIIIJ protein YidD
VARSRHFRLAGALALALAGCRTAGPRCEPVAPFVPWDSSPAQPAERSAARDLPDALLAFYQAHMRAPHLPGGGCRLRPTCSVFARQAFQRWYAAGFLLVADRLFVREHPFMDGHYLPACALGTSDDEGLLDAVP